MGIMNLQQRIVRVLTLKMNFKNAIYRFMKNHHIIAFAALLPILFYTLTGCKVKTVYVPVQSVTTVTETVRDTVLDVRLISYKDSVTVIDTLSYLENKYAYSSAIWSSGRLSHSLGIKPINIPVNIQYKEIVRTDSIPVPYPVPGPEKIVYRLRWWQEVLMWLGVAFVAFLILEIGRLVLRK